FRVSAAAHLLDDHKRAQIVEIRFAATGRTGSANRTIDIESRSEYRRVTEAPGNLPRETARSCYAADLTFGVDAVAVDRAVHVLLAQQAFREHLERRFVSGLSAFFGIEIVTRIHSAFPLQPLPARILSVQIVLDLESHVACKFLRAFTDDQVMIRV